MTTEHREPGPRSRGMAGRIVLITGASQGIGRALALRLAADGCSLGLMARRAEELERVREELHALHPQARATALPCDVRVAAAVEEAVERLVAREGRLDAAVLSAGILGELVRIADSDPAQWVETLAVNLHGSYFAARAAARAMMRQPPAGPEPPGAGERGRILFVSSGAGRPPRSPWGAYAVSKSAVDALMEVMAAEAPATGVLSASVNPGGTATPMRAQAYPEEDPATLPTAGAVAEVFARLLALSAEQYNGQHFTAREWLGL